MLTSDLQDELVVRYDELSWDYSRLETCLCDPGFFGSDCSQRTYTLPHAVSTLVCTHCQARFQLHA